MNIGLRLNSQKMQLLNRCLVAMDVKDPAVLLQEAKPLKD